jgi:two-component system sensor histidine kinase VicK
VLTNLIGNAVKYSPDGGTVRVKSEHRGERVRVSIRDQGIGIEPDDLDRIFDRYARVQQGPAAAIQGTGLGLPIAAQIVRMHGGAIWVSSSVGRGSEFVFELPIAGPENI